MVKTCRFESSLSSSTSKRSGLLQSPTENSDLDTFMPDQVPLQFLPLPPHEFDNLPAGFKYEHEISEASNTTAFDMMPETFDVVWRAARGSHPGVTRAHVIGRTEDILVRDCFLL